MGWRESGKRTVGELGGRLGLVGVGLMTVGMVVVWTLILGYEGGLDTRDPQVMYRLFWRVWVQLPPVLALAAHGVVTLGIAVLPLPVNRLFDLEKRVTVLVVGVSFLWVGSAIGRALPRFATQVEGLATVFVTLVFGLGILVTAGVGLVVSATAFTPGDVRLRGGWATVVFVTLVGTSFLAAGLTAALGLGYVVLRDGVVAPPSEWGVLVVGVVFGVALGGTGLFALSVGLSEGSLSALANVRPW